VEQRPVSVKLFLREGLPNSLSGKSSGRLMQPLRAYSGTFRTAEIVGWTGMALICPRSRLESFGRFPRSDNAAVYLLLGEDEGGNPTVYVGQTGSIGDRLRAHLRDRDKDFFDDVIAVVSKDENLTTAHVTYLEARLLQMAKQAGQARISNPNQNLVARGLPESDVADMDNFVANIATLLLALGVGILDVVAVPLAQGAAAVFELHSSGVRATATEAVGEFIVLEGSLSRGHVGTQDSYRGQRDKLIANGVLKRDQGDGDGTPYVFTRDYPFKSPSAASAVVLGRNDNGRTSWKVRGTNQTYAQWEASKINTTTERSG